MNPNMPTGETMSEGGPLAPMSEICVPLSSLAGAGEDDQPVPPEVGDAVNANIEGVVTRVEGDQAYIQLSAVNGEEIAAPSDPLAELETMAQGMPVSE